MSALDEAIAGTLGGLDELEQQLIEKQTELARELNDVETALERIAAIREAALSGGNSKPKRRSGVRKNESARIAENREQVLAYLRTADGPVPPSAIAAALDRDPRGIGPILVGLVSAELVEKLETETGGSTYQIKGGK